MFKLNVLDASRPAVLLTLLNLVLKSTSDRISVGLVLDREGCTSRLSLAAAVFAKTERGKSMSGLDKQRHVLHTLVRGVATWPGLPMLRIAPPSSGRLGSMLEPEDIFHLEHL